jgi:uncharacterized protein
VKLEHSFTVPADLDTVWEAVLDPERVAPCMPGASLTEVDGDDFKGAVKVKLGPISLLYKGSGEFLSKDADTRTVVIKASGKDARGNGTAAATVTVTLTAAGTSTTGAVATDLSITGKPAQFGRGLISEVGGKILDTFATNLAAKLAPEAAPPALTVVKNEDAKGPGEGGGKHAAGGRGEDARADDAAGSGAAEGGGAGSDAKGAVGAGKGVDENTDADAAVGTDAEKDAGKGVKRAGKDKAAAEKALASAAGQRAEAKETGREAGEAVAAEEAKRPKLTAAPEPEAEPIDLLAYAGPSVVKRALPVLGLVAAVLAFITLRRRRR